MTAVTPSGEYKRDVAMHLIGALGLITLGALIPARRGSRSALATIVVVRVISALLAVPAFFLDAPAWAMAVEGFVIVATVTALFLLRRDAGGARA